MKSTPRVDYDTLEKNALISMALRNPFFEPGVAEAVNYLNSTASKPEQAYEIILNAVTVNPYSKPLNQYVRDPVFKNRPERLCSDNQRRIALDNERRIVCQI
ncbi:MAG: hypothetical protein U5K79_00110 [Cyclobacteriaceae bacterium]|nr:hypothetical protein [Cyclobacteriaceae bacterium]